MTSSNTLEIRLIPIPAPVVYQVMRGNTFMGEFTQIGPEWNGLLQLHSHCDDHASTETIVVAPGRRFKNTVNESLGIAEIITGTVIKASPSFFDALRIADNSGTATDGAATPKGPA